MKPDESMSPTVKTTVPGVGDSSPQAGTPPSGRESRANRRRSRFNQWLRVHRHLAGWIEAVGVVVAVVFGIVQLREATSALEAAADSNRIALRAQANDLLVGVNMAALDHPEAAGEFTGARRLHLMRLHYFFRIHDLFEHGIIDDDRFEAETRYLKWVTSQEDFVAVWRAFADQYPTRFRAWVSRVIDGQRPVQSGQSSQASGH